MLRAEDNEILTRTRPGTLMGDLLRRHWTPTPPSAAKGLAEGPGTSPPSGPGEDPRSR